MPSRLHMGESPGTRMQLTMEMGRKGQSGCNGYLAFGRDPAEESWNEEQSSSGFGF